MSNYSFLKESFQTASRLVDLMLLGFSSCKISLMFVRLLFCFSKLIEKKLLRWCALHKDCGFSNKQLACDLWGRPRWLEENSKRAYAWFLLNCLFFFYKANRTNWRLCEAFDVVLPSCPVGITTAKRSWEFKVLTWRDSHLLKLVSWHAESMSDYCEHISVNHDNSSQLFHSHRWEVTHMRWNRHRKSCPAVIF